MEKGMKDGEEIIFPKEASELPGVVPGDVVFIVDQTPHPVFERIGNHLYTNLEITLEEALLGFSKTIKSLDGRNVAIEGKTITPPFHSVIITGEGMPIKGTSRFGDMHVTIKVKLPELSSEESKELASILNN
jgi:DnaJ-class molecular chaperone